MYQSPLVLNGFRDYSIEPEKLNIESIFKDSGGDDYKGNSSNYLSIEAFSELTAKNFPQPKGKVFRHTF